MAVKLDLAGFGKRVGDLRDKAGLTQKQLATVVGGGDSKVSEWESGKRAPDAESLMRLAVALGTTVDYLLTGEEGAGEWARDRLLALVNELNRGAWREPEDAPQRPVTVLGANDVNHVANPRQPTKGRKAR